MTGCHGTPWEAAGFYLGPWEISRDSTWDVISSRGFRRHPTCDLAPSNVGSSEGLPKHIVEEASIQRCFVHMWIKTVPSSFHGERDILSRGGLSHVRSLPLGCCLRIQMTIRVWMRWGGMHKTYDICSRTQRMRTTERGRGNVW